MENQSQKYYTLIQQKMPVDMERMLEVDDPIYSFNKVLCHIDLKRYFVEEEHKTGRPKYDEEKRIFGSLCGWHILQRLAIAVVSSILSEEQKRAGNSTMAQGCQSTGYASPAAALTVLCHSALGQSRGANAPPWQVLPDPDFGTHTNYRCFRVSGRLPDAHKFKPEGVVQ